MRRRRPDDTAAIRDNFAAVRVIGTGARSRVLLGIDPADNTPVVIKELDVSMLAPSAVRKWVKKAPDIVAASQHPNVVTLYAVIHQGNDLVVQLEQYCPGSSDLLVGTADALRPEQVIAVGIRMAEALTWLHERGLLHLDITAEHIRFADEATPCLADTGIGSLFPHRWRLSRGIVAAGAAHTAPELVRGSTPSAATDVYSLASVLYELLMGAPPINPLPGETPGELCRRILNDPVYPVVAPGVPRQLSELLAAALTKDPLARPATAALFAEGLWGAAGSLDQAWTGTLAIPKPASVIETHDTVIIWSPDSS